MLTLTKRVDYGLLALTGMADSDQPLSSRGLAERYNLSPTLLANVLKKLCSANLVTSIRGKNGGYKLAKAPIVMTVAEVVEALEGPFQLAACTGEHQGAGCDIAPCCSIKWSVNRIHGAIFKVLGEMTIADILADSKAGATATLADTKQFSGFHEIPLNLEV